MKKRIVVICIAVMLGGMVSAHAEPVVIEMFRATAEGVGEKVGTVTVTNTPYGTLFSPQLKGLTPGLHGFHVHENPSCQPGEKNGKKVAGLAAGGHYDPEGTGAHKGPYGDGHLGDLPALYVDEAGVAQHPVLAPRLKPLDLKGRSLMVHAGGDNYADHPEKLGGGGARIVCGVVGP